MSFILRTWGCQNAECVAVFTSGERYPACPHCGCIRVSWVPAQVNIHSGSTKQADTTLRDLCAAYGLTDINSPSPSRQLQAKKLATGAGGGAAMTFQGFTATVDPAAGAQCVPTSNHIEHKVRPGIGAPFTGQFGAPGIASNTEVVATHRGDK